MDQNQASKMDVNMLVRPKKCFLKPDKRTQTIQLGFESLLDV